jgi:FKBP-type peptidyl-prolyl cis-trans isomerase SlyD
MKAQVVSFHCILKTKLGKVVSSTFNHDVLTMTGQNDLLNGLVAGLQNLSKGEKRVIRVPAAQAYGFYEPEKVLVRPREEFGTGLRLGSRVSVPQGETKIVYRVTELTQDTVTLDANHPLAGQDLVFEIEATAARDATDAELVESSDDERSTLH